MRILQPVTLYLNTVSRLPTVLFKQCKNLATNDDTLNLFFNYLDYINTALFKILFFFIVMINRYFNI